MPKISSIEFKGFQETYDLEVEHEDHQYFLANGILNSNSHAVSYAIDSYYAAWLYTYYPKEWLATILQSETSSPKGLAKAISEIKMLGYKFIQADVNYSGVEWVYNEDAGGFVPPLAAIKGVGATAAKEIIAHRPYRNLDELLFNKEGKWYHSKMNKTAFASLCKIEAFNSLKEMKNGRIEHHSQLYEIIIENYKLLRKGRKGMTKTQVKRLAKKGEVPPDILDVLIEKTEGTVDWTRIEKIQMSYELTQTARLDLIFPQGILEKLEDKNIKPVTEIGVRKTLSWFFVVDNQVKKTRTGKPYLRVKVSDHNNNSCWLKIWGLGKPLELYTLWMCNAKGDPDWGPSTGSRDIKRIEL